MKHKFFTQLFLLLSIISVPVWSASPSMFNYAGHVSVKGDSYEGNGFFRFALVNFDCTAAASANGKNCQSLWSNDGSSTAGLAPDSAVELVVSNGKFSVNLGDTGINIMSALDPDIMQQTLYLRTWFDDGKNGSEQLKPDHLLTPVPYAINSKVSENAVGYKQSWKDYVKDKNENRSINTVYQNNTGRPITVNISSTLYGGYAHVELWTGSSNPPNVLIARSENAGYGEDAGGTVFVTGIIPPNHYYQSKSIGGLNHWSELR